MVVAALMVLMQAQVDVSDTGWTLGYAGRSYDSSSNTTTYSYQLTVADGEKDLSHLVIGTSGNIPVASSGIVTEYSNPDPTTQVTGWKWDDGQLAGTTATYTITFSGNLGEASVPYSVKGGQKYAVSSITGVGAPVVPATWSVSGVAYVDANQNGSYDAGEPAMPGLTVSLGGASVVTGANGAYVFGGLENGSYVVTVPASTPLVQDFNEVAAAYFAGPGPLSAVVSGQNSTGNNLRFVPNLCKIRTDLLCGKIKGNGRTIGFWKHQCEVAISGKGKAQVAKATLLSYLMQVQALYLPVPFQFAAGQEFKSALAILSSRSCLAGDLLAKQLLGAELNQVSGVFGLAGDYAPLLGVLNALGEYVFANLNQFSRNYVLSVKDVLDAVNNSGHF